MVQKTLVLLAVAALVMAVSRASADRFSLGVDAIIAATPQIERPEPQPPNGYGQTYYQIKGTGYDGWASPEAISYATLGNSRQVLIVPLDSRGTGVVFVAPVWTGGAGGWHYAGYIVSPNGKLSIWIEGGYITTLSPVYAASDGECCPSRWRVTRYTVDSKRLIQVDSVVLAHDRDLPAWTYIESGTRAFLGTDGAADTAAIVCPRADDYEANRMRECTPHEMGTPIVIEAISGDGEPCDRHSSVRVRAADRSWSGWVRIDSMLPAVPAGTLLEDGGSIVRVVRFDPQPSAQEPPQALVSVVSGPHSGTKRNVVLGATVLHGFLVPPVMACPNDNRFLTLRH